VKFRRQHVDSVLDQCIAPSRRLANAGWDILADFSAT
jgi:hypothetical protein